MNNVELRHVIRSIHHRHLAVNEMLRHMDMCELFLSEPFPSRVSLAGTLAAAEVRPCVLGDLFRDDEQQVLRRLRLAWSEHHQPGRPPTCAAIFRSAERAARANLFMDFVARERWPVFDAADVVKRFLTSYAGYRSCWADADRLSPTEAWLVLCGWFAGDLQQIVCERSITPYYHHHGSRMARSSPFERDDRSFPQTAHRLSLANVADPSIA